MALTFDAFSEASASFTTGGASWTHTPVNTPVAVVAFVVNTGWTGSGWSGSTVTYGGVTISGTDYQGTTTSGGVVDAYVLTSGIPTGAQTVSITNSSSLTKIAAAITIYSTSGETAVLDSNSVGGQTVAQQISQPLTHSGSLTSWMGIAGFWINEASSATNVQTGDHYAGGFSFGTPSAAFLYTGTADASPASSSTYGYTTGQTNTVYAYSILAFRGVSGGNTALTLYQTNSAATTVTTANKLQATAPASETSVLATKQQPKTTTGWVELCSQAQSATTGSYSAANPAPTGNGWLFDVTTLEGQQILAGNWTPSIVLQAGAAVTAELHCRVYKRSSGGSYTELTSSGTATDIIKTGASIATTKTTLAFPATSLDLTTFATGDKLYVDLWANVTTGFSSNTASARTFTLYENAGATESIATPGYQAIPVTPLSPAAICQVAVSRAAIF